MTAPLAAPAMSLRDSRRRLAMDGLGIVVTALGFGLVYGLSARQAGFSLVEAVAMSTIVFAGAAQFAAVGYVAGGLGWPAVIVLTAFLNARHLLYSAAISPWLARTPRPTRAVMAHVLTDEAFALSIAHFRRVGRTDIPGYWFAAIVITWIPWNAATIAGVLLGGAVADPTAIGLDVVFPAAMAGLALGLATGHREIVAAFAGAVVGVLVALAWAPSAGVVAGGLAGPAIAMAVTAGQVRPAGPTATPDTDPGSDPDIGVAP